MTRSVLFVCNMNSIRSPMAAAILAADAGDSMLVDSAGVYEGGPDPFIERVLAEIDTPMTSNAPKALSDVNLSAFDVIVCLTPEAAGATRKLAPAVPVEYWSIDNPTDVRGGEAALLGAYRAARDQILTHIRDRFPIAA